MTSPSPTGPAADRLATGKLPIDLLAHLLGAFTPTDPSIVVGPGIGRDAAVIRLGDRLLVAKSDPITFVSHGAADYLVDVNANDLACLGATPRWLLATALFRDGIGAAEVEAHFADLAAACRARNIALVGGHSEVMAGLDRTVLVGMLLGEADPVTFLPPGGAQLGDAVLLTKGISVEGSALLARELGHRLRPEVGGDVVDRAAGFLASPGISIQPEARAVIATGAVHALHDPTEGGLAMAVREIAAASGHGVRLVRAAVPVLPETRAIAEVLGLDPLGMLASGSLLIACAPADKRRVMDACAEIGVPVARIGEVIPEGFVLVDHDGERELPSFQTDEVSRALVAARAG